MISEILEEKKISQNSSMDLSTVEGVILLPLCSVNFKAVEPWVNEWLLLFTASLQFQSDLSSKTQNVIQKMF